MVIDTTIWKLSNIFLPTTMESRARSTDKTELSQFLTPTGKPIPIDSKSNDLWFQHIAIVVSDMAAAYRHLRKFKVQHVSTAPQTIPKWNKAAADIQAFYFQDPDRHNLEIIYFPPGTGNPKWQKSDRVFLGIDHTAIVVSNTRASLRFYRDFLGMKIAGSSENYGTEQEHLNLVFGAHLKITALQAPKGPGIELLEYLTPGDGRPYPGDARPNDIYHWQTTLLSNNARALFQQARDNDHRLISPELTELPAKMLDFSKGFMMRDPDGHALQIIQIAQDK